ncbi:hypothetical protein C8A05DRAFT_14568 [Staphylotrichum tortipilum]|uniref:Uncharacterized protein n=1 Tax=Staphylotrichum tortipilum TaxID=2831512 RepID=A0AAN6MNA4_9PEZI|nr:hypothetical protein C8A05DRAFT_14568 [Staphylotrichum longicolle]
MSISRAFTNRRVKQSIRAAEISENAPQRSNSIRNKISSPVQLLHTTNMLSYNAPDIHPMSASSTSSSPRSDDDMSDSALTAGTTPPTSPDVETASKRSLSPAPNHLSSHFILADRQKPAPTIARPEAPVIPQRALSQPRKPNTLVRQRSASNMSQQSRGSASTKASFSFSRSSSTSTSTSVSSGPPYTHHKPKLPSTAAIPTSPAASPSPPRAQLPPRSQQPPPPRAPQQHPHQPPPPSPIQQQQQHRKDYSDSKHPFGPELAQVSEIAEEYGVREHLASALEFEEREMKARGLRKFSADDYLSEVRGLFASFMAPPRPVAAAWI